jgi:hypothetical protein
MSLLITISLMTLFCNGWYMITRDGMILDPVRKLFLTAVGGWDRSDGGIEWDEYRRFHVILIPRFFYKPLFGCIICMASIPGSVAFWCVSKMTEANLIYWPIACVCCAFTNYFVYVLLKKIEG